MALNFTGHAAFAGMAMALEFTKQALDFTTALALAAVGGLGSGLETGCS